MENSSDADESNPNSPCGYRRQKYLPLPVSTVHLLSVTNTLLLNQNTTFALSNKHIAIVSS